MFHYILSNIKSLFGNEISEAVFLGNREVIELNKIIDYQSVIQSPDQAIGPVSVPDNRERSDTYYNIAFLIDEKWRVIVCPDGIQWILQVRKGSLDGRPAWNGVSFCRSRTGLSRATREKARNISPEVEAQLAQLPDWVES
ncbi:hypothetical protein [Mesorhizobium sp. M1322]|uniref:hypothetical protein n=1 Tax=Mesorhizobium sp. M1322 TaxID=2957081 RepID=UPI00333A7AB9